MAVEKIEGVNPTRMELLEISRRRRLAEKGHKLLTEKRDALVVQFFDLLERRKDLRGGVDKSTEEAYRSLFVAETRYGTSSVEDIALSTEGADDIEGSLVSVMGVLVPQMEFQGKRKDGFPYSITDTGASLDEASDKFSTTLKSIVRLAETEGALERMAVEIEKTKRRVNALEHIFIPRLKATEKYISMQLEEREREDFFRRKRIKSLMEGSAKNERAS